MLNLTFVMPEMGTTAARLLEVSVSGMGTGGPAGRAGAQELSQDSCENSCPNQRHDVR